MQIQESNDPAAKLGIKDKHINQRKRLGQFKDTSEPKFSPTIRLKQPRVKRRPTLDTNLSRSASKPLIPNQ